MRALSVLVLATLAVLLVCRVGESVPTPSGDLCEACHAIVHQGTLKLRMRSVVAIMDFLEGVCDQEKLRIYKMIPPKMAALCRKFIEDFEEDIELILMKSGAWEEPEYQGCHVELRVCDGYEYERTDYADRLTRRRALGNSVSRLRAALNSSHTHFSEKLAEEHRAKALKAAEAVDAFLAAEATPTSKDIIQHNTTLFQDAAHVFEIQTAIEAHEDCKRTVENLAKSHNKRLKDGKEEISEKEKLDREAALEKLQTASEYLASHLTEPAETYKALKQKMQKMDTSIFEKMQKGKYKKASKSADTTPTTGTFNADKEL